MKTSAKPTFLAFGLVLLAGCAASGRADGPFAGFRFNVEIDGVFSGEILTISGLSSESQVTEYREGGEANTVRKLPGHHSYANVVLRRRAGTDQSWWDWRKQIVDGDTGFRRTVAISILDHAGNQMRRWNLIQAWPAAYRIVPLKSHHREVVLEEIELAVDEIVSALP